MVVPSGAGRGTKGPPPPGSNRGLRFDVLETGVDTLLLSEERQKRQTRTNDDDERRETDLLKRL